MINHENHIIQYENHENHENPRIPNENNENHENLRISFENKRFFKTIEFLSIIIKKMKNHRILHQNQ